MSSSGRLKYGLGLVVTLALFSLLNSAILSSLPPPHYDLCAPSPPLCTGTLTVNYPANLGLGNMLFFYATLMGVANRTRKPPFFPLNIHFSPFEVFHLGPVTSDNFILGKDTEVVKEEASGRFLPKAFRLPCEKHVILEGYYQSWRYFANIEAELRERLRRFQTEVSYQCAAKIRETLYRLNLRRSGVHLVGVHLRRGDFTRTSAQEYGFAPAKASFIRNAIEHFKARRSNIRDGKKLVFFVLGNDYEWNRNNTPTNTRDNILVLEPSKEAGVDLCVLSRSDSHVISTGSFGWWAAFIGNGYTIYQSEYAHWNTSLYERIEPRDYFMPKWIAVN